MFMSYMFIHRVFRVNLGPVNVSRHGEVGVVHSSIYSIFFIFSMLLRDVGFTNLCQFTVELLLSPSLLSDLG